MMEMDKHQLPDLVTQGSNPIILTVCDFIHAVLLLEVHSIKCDDNGTETRSY